MNYTYHDLTENQREAAAAVYLTDFNDNKQTAHIDTYHRCFLIIQTSDGSSCIVFHGTTIY